MEKEIIVPELIFDEAAEVISNVDIIRYAITNKIPITFTFRDKERIVKPTILYTVNGDDYLVRYNLETDRLMTYSLNEIGMVYLLEGTISSNVVDITKSQNLPDKRLLSKRTRKSLEKNICCSFKTGDRVIGEVDEEGIMRIHKWNCKEANRYWWS